MAFASDSTPAPIRPLLRLSALSSLDRRAIGRDGWAHAREAAARVLLPAGSTAPTANDARALASKSVSESAAPLLPLPAPLPPLAAALSRRRAIFGGVTVDEPDTAAEAHTLHLRRRLEAAAEHGAALLAVFNLPRLVGSDFIQIDPVAAGEAIEAAVTALDALDGDADLEDGADDELSLGWEKPGSQLILTEGAYSSDREHDTADAEPSLASPERHPEVPVCFFGAPYTARGGSEAQLRWAEGARDDREMVDEDGPIDEDELDGAGDVDPEPSIGWPEDFTAEVVPMLEASADAEHDDADSEDGDDDDDRTADDSSLRVWVFGPSRREVVHV